jgi:flagellar L-ring protein precursor FlgH
MMKRTLAQAAVAAAAICLLIGLAGPAEATSLFERRAKDSLIADSKARRVGDLLTIIIIEESSASQDTSIERKKASSTDASITTLFWENSKGITHHGDRPKFAWESSRESSGEGKSDSSSTLETKVTARVIDVQPNGNMLIEATRQIEMGGSSLKIVLTGLVRPDDVSADNTVESTYIADAKITYEGPMMEVMKRGLLERLMDFLNIF